MPPATLKPLSLRKEGDGLAIEWNDHVHTFVTWRHLRANCPCAGCLEERAKPADPFRVLSQREIEAGSPTPVSMVACGFYAYKIVWNDGHDSGIYAIENLRELSEIRSQSQEPL